MKRSFIFTGDHHNNKRYFAQCDCPDEKDSTEMIFINAKGGIHNHAGTKLWYIDKNDTVRDNTSKELYFIDKDGHVISSDGRKLGMGKRTGPTIISMARMF
jgi:hypothetical protein